MCQSYRPAESPAHTGLQSGAARRRRKMSASPGPPASQPQASCCAARSRDASARGGLGPRGPGARVARRGRRRRRRRLRRPLRGAARRRVPRRGRPVARALLRGLQHHLPRRRGRRGGGDDVARQAGRRQGGARARTPCGGLHDGWGGRTLGRFPYQEAAWQPRSRCVRAAGRKAHPKRALPTNLAHFFAEIGQTCAIMTATRPSSADFGPDSAEIGRSRPTLGQSFGPTWGDVGRHRPESSQVSPTLARTRPPLGDFGRTWAKSGHNSMQPKILVFGYPQGRRRDKHHAPVVATRHARQLGVPAASKHVGDIMRALPDLGPRAALLASRKRRLRWRLHSSPRRRVRLLWGRTPLARPLPNVPACHGRLRRGSWPPA